MRPDVTRSAIAAVPSPEDAPPDARLIERVLAGDVRAFTVLVERYRPRFVRFAVRMTGSRDEAEEVLQEASVRAWRSLAQCADRDRFGAWFHRIVVNAARTRATRNGRREERFVRDEEALDALAAPDRGVGDVALREEIDRALLLLVPEQREAFVLKYVEELEYEEMAALTGVGVSALKMRVKRACERLRALLEAVHHG